jgi:hypothetical protein
MEAGTPAIEAAGHHPTGNPTEDEKTAIRPLTAKTPLGVPWIASEDIAPLVVFLASDGARMVTAAPSPHPAGTAPTSPGSPLVAGMVERAVKEVASWLHGESGDDRRAVTWTADPTQSGQTDRFRRLLSFRP